MLQLVAMTITTPVHTAALVIEIGVLAGGGGEMAFSPGSNIAVIAAKTLFPCNRDAGEGEDVWISTTIE